MSSKKLSFTARQVTAAWIDISLELGAGLLGAYFGAAIAALWTTLNDNSSLLMKGSVRSGLGFGFLFWFFCFSFLNRVIYQGVVHASIGKHFMDLELFHVNKKFTWIALMKRWVLEFASLLFFGLGYVFSLFHGSKKTFHDYILGFTVIDPVTLRALPNEPALEEKKAA